MSNKMNKGVKGILLVVGASVVTLGVTVLIIVLAIMILLEPHSCSAMSRALLVLWGTIALVILTSVIVVGVAAWKIIPDTTGRVAIVAVYGLAMLASYVFIAFGLMVAFNC